MAKKEPKRFKYIAEGGAYLDLRKLKLSPLKEIDLTKTDKLAKIIRGLAFVAIESIASGHPGGSSSKVEQILSLLLSGDLKFDPLNPKSSRQRQGGLVSRPLHPVIPFGFVVDLRMLENERGEI